MNIKILGSECAISDEYLKNVKKIAEELNYEFSIEKIIEEEKMEKYGVTINCMYGYCTGCNWINKDTDDKHTPALVIDDELVLSNLYPMDDVFVEALKRFG